MECHLLLAVFLARYVVISKALPCDNVRFDNGEIITSAKSVYDSGTELKFKCDVGYKGIGKGTITCLPNGHWSGPVPYCQAFICSRDQSSVEKGRRCRKPCSSHSNCRGTFKRCLCDDVCGKSCFNPNADCPKPTAPKNGYVVHNELMYGHTIFYGCDEGYSLSGPQTRRCRSDRQWSGFMPRCIEYGVCGQAGDVQQNVKYKVIEGTNAKEGAWPWQALLFKHNEPFDSRAGFAGGTIISNKWILTAAHIHIEFPLMLKKKIWKQSFMIALGFLQYPWPGDQISPNADFLEPEDFIIHSKFNEISMDYDIALIRVGNHMKEDGSKFVVDNTRTHGIIQFSQYIRPTCLPCMKDYASPVGDLEFNFHKSECSSLKDQKDVDAGTEVIVTGFGLKRDPGGPSMTTYTPDILQQGLLSVWTEERCIEANQKIKQIDQNSRYTKRMLCAKSANKTKLVDSCKGDSGGPIVKVVGNKEENRWIQIGIVSWGLNCGNQHPGFYTSVTPLMPWIMETIKQKVVPKWSEWTDWSACSTTCGYGKSTRNRSCPVVPSTCEGEDTQSRACKDINCPIILSTWGEWTEWSSCSTTCDIGISSRSRSCSVGTNSCEGDSIETRGCKEKNCPEDCSWLDWKEQDCMYVSGKGYRVTQTRNKKPARHGGKDCIGSATREIECDPPVRKEKQSPKKNCEVEYRSKCFTYVAKVTRIDEGRSLCTNIGGKLANIYDTTHYKLIEHYLRQQIGAGTVLYTWTGLTYQNEKFFLTSGKEVVFPKEYYYSNIPPRVSSLATTHLYVSKNPTSRLRGLNIPPQEAQAYGSLCERKNCELEYGSKCFTYVAKVSRIDEGRSLCTKIGSRLANIYDATHHKMIEDYLRTKIEGSVFYTWTGVTYQNKKFHLTTGEEVVFPREDLYSGLPDVSTESTTHLYVSKDLSSTLRGIAIPPQGSQAYGSLCEEICDVAYKSKCFTYVAKISRIDEGRSLCTKIGGQLANIYDTTHYKMIEEYLRKRISAGAVLYTWTGLTYQNRKFYLTTGEEVIFSREYWYSKSPPDFSSKATTHLYVSTDPASTLRGIAVPPQNSQAYGSLCEM